MQLKECKKEIQINPQENQTPKKPEEKPSELPPKEFHCRNSVLTDLWEMPGPRPVYNFVLSIMILSYLHAVLLLCFEDYDRILSALSLIPLTFGKLHLVALIWIAMMGSVLLVLYPTFWFWATSRLLSQRVGLYDVLFLMIFITFQLAFLILPCKIIIHNDLHIMSSLIIVMEQVRLIMKSHSFVRENVEKVLKYKPHQDGDEKDVIKPCPDLGKLLYFLFAPTLVYRDSYPRTSHIRWRIVAKYFFELVGCTGSCCIIFYLLVFINFKNFGTESQSLENIVGVLFVSIFSSGFIFMCYYIFFECWLNAFAEMLRFGDRMFYQDWWNCMLYFEFPKRFNRVVHDWLYSYIYKDTYYLLGKSRVCARVIVFVFSGLLHEYVVGVIFKHGFPMMLFTVFFHGVILTFITPKRPGNAVNVLIWTSWLHGWQIFLSYHSVEWFARKHCPRVLDPWLDYFLPRSLTCN